MENFDDFENKNYRPAKVPTYNFKDHLVFRWRFVHFAVCVWFVASWDILCEICKFFWPRKSKKIGGQMALVTGGANGLGRAIAFRLAQEKCNLVIADLNLAEAQRTATEISEKFQVKTAAFRVDVSSIDEVQRLKIMIEEHLGYVDILVNNAGILSKISLLNGQTKDIQKVIDVNLTSHFWTVRTFLETMKERKSGHIVAISSVSGLVTFPKYCAYSATKFGVRGFMSSLFDELCLDNSDKFISTTTVFPYFINTRMELSDVIDTLQEYWPRISSEDAANQIVKAVLANKRNLVIPGRLSFIGLVNYLPTHTVKFIKAGLMKSEKPNV